jgi:integrase
MAQPFKSKSGIYQLRRKVPTELRPVLGREYKRTLKTRDPVQAKANFAQEWANSEAAFSLARAELDGTYVLSARDAQLLAARWYQAELDKMEASGDFESWLYSQGQVVVDQGDTYHEYERFDTYRQQLGSDPDWDYAAYVHTWMQKAVRDQGVPMPARQATGYSLLASAFREQSLTLSDIAMQRRKGNWHEQAKLIPSEHLAVESARKSKSLRSTFDDYAAEKRLNDGDTRGVEKTIATFRATVEQFIELTGAMKVADITRDIIGKYRASISGLPAKGEGIRKLTAAQLIVKARAENLPTIGPGTVRNKLRAVSAVLSYAVRMGHITENPVIASGMGKAAAKAATKAVGGAKRRTDYSKEELSRIFSSPIFTNPSWAPPRADFGKAWYWLPLLMYYTGARREELAQLAASEVAVSDDGIAYLNILAVTSDDDAGRSVKNAGSRRLIPLHPDLIARGFLAYAKGVPANGQLFPKLKADPYGYFGSNFGKRWTSYLHDTVGLRTTVKPAHGFRHTFKTLCREVAIPEDVHDALTGHAGNGGVARDYGTMPLTRMADEIKKYPRVPLIGQNAATF